jgi:hypothetical protein
MRCFGESGFEISYQYGSSFEFCVFLGNTATTNGWFHVTGVFLGVENCIFGQSNFAQGLITLSSGSCSVWILHSTFDTNDIEATVPPAALSMLLVNPKIVEELDRTAYASLPLKCFALYMTQTNVFSKTESLFSKSGSFFSKTQSYSSSGAFPKSAVISESKKMAASSYLSTSLTFSATEGLFSRTQSYSETTVWSKSGTVSKSESLEESSKLTDSMKLSLSDNVKESLSFSDTVKFSILSSVKSTLCFSSTNVFESSLEEAYTISQRFTDTSSFSNSFIFPSSSRISLTNVYEKTQGLSATFPLSGSKSLIEVVPAATPGIGIPAAKKKNG